MTTLSETIADVVQQILMLLIITLFLFTYMHSVSEWKITHAFLNSELLAKRASDVMTQDSDRQTEMVDDFEDFFKGKSQCF